MFSPKQIKLIVLIILALVLTIVSYQAFVYWSHRGLAKINVVVLPKDSELRVDGSPAKAGTLYLKPGAHKLSAARQYFDKVEQEVNTNNLNSGEKIYLLPKPNSNEAKQWLAEHPDVQRQRESVGGIEANQQQTALSKKYPFLDKLPQENSRYKIDYSLTQANELEFTINLFGVVRSPNDYAQYKQQLKQYKNEALQYLQSIGVNPQDYKITYSPAVD